MANDPRLPALWPSAGADPFAALRRQMEDAFADFGGRLPALVGRVGQFTPSIDVVESDKAIKLTAELPGMSEKDIEITLSGRMLSIKGEKKQESESKSDEKGHVVHTTERSYGMFQRSMALPFDLEPGQVEADFRNGVLTVTLPKPPTAVAETRRIAIKGAG